MRNQTIKEEQNDPMGQKQDPIERRRLQNRLSQRNHRRKIRDRIAKLQERVIASELRAAASLNGWGYPNLTGPPPIDHVSSYEAEGKNPSRASENTLHADPSYLSTPSGVCPTCSNSLGPIPIICSQPLTPPSIFDPAKETESPNSSPSSTMMNSPYDSGFNLTNPEISPTALNNYSVAELNAPLVSETWDGHANDSTFSYVATETSLPQIVQALGGEASRTKAVILIPQNPHSTGIPLTLAVSQLPTPVDSVGTAMSPMQTFTCPCQPQESFPGSGVGFVNSGGPPPPCPIHATQSVEHIPR
ncbi:hypothetical protein EYZ11_001090 [Aspergillus tanneri]|uniref:BZIP domain-containing protein n=1 Tax=Aspergillus tanneri TaxID=1220188 RepID=A0A4S3JVI7_9EURO|nr:uncharacterized protein ATNIH1004_009722 [Aspergillus tanneri]KAA8642960.1 hypothetical protein ATNIH1004_009722 [Aspergillus tanneri]THC99452.1 hypothetical protein EYZ11_001090 [Aspergillus tanneri]